MQILFITSNRLGDAVLSTGLLGALIERHPEARLTLACGALPAPLFATMPNVDLVLPLVKRPWAGHWLGLWRLAVARRWDLVVDLRASAIAWTLWAGRRRVLDTAKSNAPVHRVRQLSELFELDEPAAPRLWLDAASLARAAELVPGPEVICLAPTANWGGKRWPAEHFAELGRRLAEPAAAIAVVAAPGEREMAAPVLDSVPPERLIDLVGTQELPVLAACLARMKLYVGNDSGLMHLAAAAGAPTLGLFGPSRDVHYAPWGEGCAFVRTPESYEDLIGAPGFDHRSQQSLMTSLEVATVEAKAREMLA
ncbi:MAG TPA: glycosyltransferase family 9 protein [Alphaproteobacteria bacterium]|nr:glycosyltransferase family 9 protein [Alphaproteobacteria bacterium]MDP6269094.1 glycosyltransferase family 9 protein [Alphaproteobacteria bacterium]MDP7164464.1 glycosyltransferase family 9 protein [Alphaproteobacteria bacterium]MDP7429810.1 glycosyltransferase family 9 protein [Alphaproteobacteria bacterium]HJM49599.1 glycosyltransferase family 9 protein [Alphaproteobacteria bacterium]